MRHEQGYYIRKILRKEDEGIYIYIPIEIEEDVERLEISYDYTPWRPKGSAWLNDVDMILIDDKGCDVGTEVQLLDMQSLVHTIQHPGLM